MNSQARFEQAFTGPASAVRARIWQQVYGPEYPAWAGPFSYISVTELRQFTHELHQHLASAWLMPAAATVRRRS